MKLIWFQLIHRCKFILFRSIYNWFCSYYCLFQWNLVCTRAGLAELTQTFIAAGQCIGALLFSSMADRFGRKPILVFTNLCLFIVGAVTFFVPSYTIFAITRLLMGALQQVNAITSIHDIKLSFSIRNVHCESIFIRWHKFLWFLQNALIPGFLNSWFQTLQATINGKIVFRWSLNFVV